MHQGEIATAAFSGRGNLLLTGGKDGEAKLWETKTGVMLREYKGHQAEIVMVGFAASQDHIYTVSKDSTIRIWPLMSPIPETTWSLSPGSSGNLAVSSSGQLGVSGYREMNLIDPDQDHVQHTIPLSNSVVHSTFTPEGRWLICEDHEGHLYQLDLESGAQESFEQNSRRQLIDLVVSPKRGLPVYRIYRCHKGNHSMG